VKKKSVKERGKVAGRAEGAAPAARGRGRGGPERSSSERGRGRGGISGSNQWLTMELTWVEGRGTRGRGRGGEVRGRGRGGASTISPLGTDATSTTATIASDETPNVWGEPTAVDEPFPAESEDINGINGTKAYEDSPPQPSSVWGLLPPTAAATKPAKPHVEEVPQRAAVNGTPPITTPAAPPTRRVDPAAKMSWASIVKPAPPPAPKPAPPVQTPKTIPAPPPLAQVQPESPAQAPQPIASSRPSTRGHDIVEEPAQTIHDPFTTAEPASKPKVQLPSQPVLPYIPSLISQQPAAAPAKEPLASPSTQAPLTGPNLHLLEDQQSPVPEPPTASVTAHRASPATGTKTEGPPGLGAASRFARPTRENPVIMPTLASQSLTGLPVQFGYARLNQW
jgi:hypothetical protein